MENSNYTNGSNPVKYWYLPLILGLIFIAVGIWVIFAPVESFLAFSMLFAVAFLISGILGISYAISNRKIISAWGWSLASGIAELLIGILLIGRPDISAIILALFVGFAVLFRSIMAIIWAYEFKKLVDPGWRGLLILGILGVLFSLILLWNPVLAGLTVVVYASAAFIVTGGFQVYFSLKLKKQKK